MLRLKAYSSTSTSIWILIFFTISVQDKLSEELAHKRYFNCSTNTSPDAEITIMRVKGAADFLSLKSKFVKRLRCRKFAIGAGAAVV